MQKISHETKTNVLYNIYVRKIFTFYFNQN
jgi:hypothetical protein